MTAFLLGTFFGAIMAVVIVALLSVSGGDDDI